MSKEHDLLAPGITTRGGVWAELGSGTGTFTLVLRELLGSQAQIFSVDRDAHALEKQRQAMETQYPGTKISYIQGDFTKPLKFPPLDGILMANALHLIKFDEQSAACQQISTYLRPDGGKLLIVEHESRRGSPWVPFPVDYESFQYLAAEAGLSDIHRLAIQPVRFHGDLYSAIGLRFAQ